MRLGFAVMTFSIALVSASCGAPAAPARAPEISNEERPPPALVAESETPPEPTGATTPPEPTISTIPNQCSNENAAGICSPPSGFAKEVCGGFAKPDLALVLFAKGSPWTRAYLRLNVDAWYTGSRSARVGLKTNEEVIVLHHPNPQGGIIVNGGGAPFDVIRLDGNCATLSSEEVTLKRRASPRHAIVPWRQLDPRTRETLLADPAIADASSSFDEGCADPTPPPCAKAGDKLTALILDFMARGGKIPMRLSRR
jgi:hypothetical protein